jgi:hypothetical protein
MRIKGSSCTFGGGNGKMGNIPGFAIFHRAACYGDGLQVSKNGSRRPYRPIFLGESLSAKELSQFKEKEKLS